MYCMPVSAPYERLVELGRLGAGIGQSVWRISGRVGHGQALDGRKEAAGGEPDAGLSRAASELREKPIGDCG